jgi:hypothetical protein
MHNVNDIHSEFYELKPGWFIRLVPGENPLMSRYRHGPAVFAAMVVAGTAMQVYSTYQQGKQQEEIAEKNALILKNKAKQEEARGDQAARLAQDKAALKQKQAKAFAAEQQVGLAARNIKLGVGISEVIKADTEEKAAKEVGYMMDEGYNQKRALYMEAQSSRMEAEIWEEDGRNKRRNSYWQMGIQAATGIATLANMGNTGGGGQGGGTPGKDIVGGKPRRSNMWDDRRKKRVHGLPSAPIGGSSGSGGN